MNHAHAINARVPLRRAAHADDGFNSYLLNVHFVAPDGKEWASIGGGESVEKAVASAREALPDSVWGLARWNHLYGE
jgi:hypothetical protein